MTARLFGVGAAVAAVLSAGATAGTPSRIVDRTFVCQTVVHAGVRGIGLLASPANSFARSEQNLHVLGGVGMSSPSLAWTGTEGVRVHVKLCRAAPAARVRLRADALTGGVEKFPAEYECELPGRLLVRVRATLARPAPWLRRTPTHAGVDGKVTTAAIAVRSLALRKPIAFTSFDAKGVRVFLDPTRCVRD